VLARLLIAAALALPAIAVAAPPLEAYGKLPRLEQVRLSPSGDRLAFVAVVKEERTLVAVALDSKTPLIRSPVGSAKLRALDWAGDDRILVTYTQTTMLPDTFRVRRMETAGVLSVDLKTKTAIPIFERSRDLLPVVIGSYGVREVGGRWYGYFGALPQRNLGQMPPDLYKVDLEQSSAKWAAQGDWGVEGWVLGPEGEVVARSKYNDETSQWRLYEGRSGKPVISRKSALNSIRLRGLGRTPDTVLVIDNEGDDDAVFEQPLTPDAAGRPLFGDEQVSQYLYDPQTSLLVGALVDEGGRAVLFDRRKQDSFNAVAKGFEGLHVSLVDYTADFDRMVVFTDGADDSGTYWLVDIARKDARRIGSAYPEVSTADVGPTRMFAFKAADGLEMEGVLTLPPGREPKSLPVVVLPHGGPIGVEDAVGFDWMAQAFASRGYAVLQPNFRGSGGYGHAFREAGMGEWGRKMQTDVSDGLAALAAQGVVDPKRACIVGGSYGGYAALAGVTLQQGLYRCAVSYGGVSDLTGMLGHLEARSGDRSDSTRYWRAAIGSRADMRAYSPTDKADRADAPVLLIHGKDDTVVPFAQSEKMDRALRRAGKPVQLIELEGEDHWLSREPSRLAMITASVAFVEKHNPPN
jgi:dienelactone hydrolase